MRLINTIIVITFFLFTYLINIETSLAVNDEYTFLDDIKQIDWVRIELEAKRKEMISNSINQQIIDLKSRGDVYNWKREDIQNGINYIQNVHTGTIGSTEGSAFISKGIIKATHENGEMDASHTLMGIGEGLFVEAGGGDRGNNVHRVRAVDVYIHEMENNGRVRLQEIPGLRNKSKDEAVKFALSKVGAEYDKSGAILGDYGGNSDDWYCSELVYYSFKETGTKLQTATNVTWQTGISWVTDLTNIAPQELVNSRYNGKPLQITTFDDPSDHVNIESVHKKAKNDYIDLCIKIAKHKGDDSKDAAKKAGTEYDRLRAVADPEFAAVLDRKNEKAEKQLKVRQNAFKSEFIKAKQQLEILKGVDPVKAKEIAEKEAMAIEKKANAESGDIWAKTIYNANKAIEDLIGMIEKSKYSETFNEKINDGNSGVKLKPHQLETEKSSGTLLKPQKLPKPKHLPKTKPLPAVKPLPKPKKLPPIKPLPKPQPLPW